VRSDPSIALLRLSGALQADSVADLAAVVGTPHIRYLLQATARFEGSAAILIAENLTGHLWSLCRSSLRRSRTTFRRLLPQIFTLRRRPLDLGFLAVAPTVYSVPRATSDLHAALAIRPIACVADQRADASGLALHSVQGIDACNLHVQLQARVLVEQIKC